MALKITRPYFADRAKGSLFPGFRLTTHGENATLAALSWPPPKVKRHAPAGAALLTLRAKVRTVQPLYRLDALTNATQQAARSAFPANGARLSYYSQKTRLEFGPVTGPRTLYLAQHPPATPTSHAAPT